MKKYIVFVIVFLSITTVVFSLRSCADGATFFSKSDPADSKDGQVVILGDSAEVTIPEYKGITTTEEELRAAIRAEEQAQQSKNLVGSLVAGLLGAMFTEAGKDAWKWIRTKISELFNKNSPKKDYT